MDHSPGSAVLRHGAKTAVGLVLAAVIAASCSGGVLDGVAVPTTTALDGSASSPTSSEPGSPADTGSADNPKLDSGTAHTTGV